MAGRPPPTRGNLSLPSHHQEHQMCNTSDVDQALALVDQLDPLRTEAEAQLPILAEVGR